MVYLPGAETYLNECTVISTEEANEENEEETEAYHATIEFEDQEDPDSLCKGKGSLREPLTANKRFRCGLGNLDNQLKKASEAVVVASTRNEYERCVEFSLTDDCHPPSSLSAHHMPQILETVL